MYTGSPRYTVTFSQLGNELYYGRLGNQMWQIASTVGIALENQSTYAFPLWKYSEYLYNKLPFMRMVPRNQVTERDPFSFDLPMINCDTDISGYFQNKNYFIKYTSYIKEIFRLKEDIQTRLYKKYNRFFDYEDSVCSIHVRRGDYLTKPHIHPVQNLDYFNNAKNRMPKHTKYMIFSDDLDWCKENNLGDLYVHEDIDLFDLYVMSRCHHNIISNSSFSWWAAFLNPYLEKIVVMPKNWSGQFENAYRSLQIEGWLAI